MTIFKGLDSEKNFLKLDIFQKQSIIISLEAGMAELADAWDLKSHGELSPCRFKSGSRHSSNCSGVEQPGSSLGS